ncbi:hypothetical protein RCH23_003186 [Cryobacterium sp. CAN_C3]|nr:hypothetical protein [Cryobacterium sp. CAN_C3]
MGRRRLAFVSGHEMVHANRVSALLRCRGLDGPLKQTTIDAPFIFGAGLDSPVERTGELAVILKKTGRTRP